MVCLLYLFILKRKVCGKLPCSMAVKECARPCCMHDKVHRIRPSVARHHVLLVIVRGSYNISLLYCLCLVHAERCSPSAKKSASATKRRMGLRWHQHRRRSPPWRQLQWRMKARASPTLQSLAPERHQPTLELLQQSRAPSVRRRRT